MASSSKMAAEHDQELLDYEEEDEAIVDGKDAPAKKDVKGSYVSIHSSGFRDFLLKPEILKAIVDCGFEHPSEVQHECIPQAVLGMDILGQAKSGMGKTAVFVLATLQQIDPVDGQVSALIMCHTRELAYQIAKEYERFSKYMSNIKVGVFFGGMPITKKPLRTIAHPLLLRHQDVCLPWSRARSLISRTLNISFLMNVIRCLNNLI